jgi:signal transduction histidine kinase
VQNFIDRYFFKGTAREISQENTRLHQELINQDRMKAVATLAASMAHEIKNPLTSIKTFTEFLPEKHNDADFIKNFMRIVLPQVERIDFTVKQLLEFSKPAIAKLKPIKIYDVVSETIELLSSDFISHRIKTVLDFACKDTIISGDYNQLKQVFLNLLLNALDAMPKGGILTVSGRIIQNENYIFGQKLDKFIEITINDTGSGIPNDKMESVFNPFFTTKPNGTGLGLSIVKDIIDSHKATIGVESKIGSGTKFCMIFPIYPDIK